MEAILSSDDEINRRVYVFPTSPIEEDGKKIPYFEFILLTAQKEFYMVMISERKAKIIDYTMEQLMKLEQQEMVHEEQQDHRPQFSV